MNVVKTNKKINSKSVYDTTQKKSLSAILRQTKEENNRIKKTLPTTTGEGENITLSKTAELEFIQPPLPRGNSEQIDVTDNLFDNTWESGDIDGTSGNNYTGSSSIRTTNYIRIYPNHLYTISRDLTTGYNKYRFYDINKQFISAQGSSVMTSDKTDHRLAKEQSSMTFTITDTNIAYMRVVDNSTNTNIKYTLTTASINPDYPSAITNVTGDVEVLVQNKNLLDMTNSEQGGINNTSGEPITSINQWRTTEFISVSSNTAYTMAFSGTSSNTITMRISEYDENKNFIQRLSNDTNITFTTTASTKYIKWVIYYNNVVTTLENVTALKLQLEQGSTATTYTPHKEQTYTFPLGTQRMYLGDYLADDGIHHVRGQVTFDGSSDESWTYASSSAAPYRITLNNMKPNGATHSVPNIKCSHFIAVAWYEDFNDYDSLIVSPSSGTYFAFRNADISTSAEWKTWLSTHNVTVEYELATEEITPYTTEQQQAYNEIKQAISYEEQTNISGSSNESNPLFSVEAYQSTKLILENIDSRLTIVES